MSNRDSLSDKSTLVLREAFEFASENNRGYAGSEHLLWSLCSDKFGAAASALFNAGFDRELIRKYIERYSPASSSYPYAEVSLNQDGERVMQLAAAQGRKLKHKGIEPEHVLLGLLQEKSCAGAKLIEGAGANPDEIMDELLSTLGLLWPEERKAKDKPKTKTLEKYSRNLTAMAAEGKLDPVIGRDMEIRRMTEILSRRTKNNPILLGDPGTGKTAVAEGLAIRLVQSDVPENLKDMQLMSLDLGKMVSGTRYRGDFEERIKDYIDEAKNAGNVILFIDEIHMLVGAGSAEGGIDAAGVFKPALSRGELKVIGATTPKEYKKHIEKDSALERRFQPIEIKEPDAEKAVLILKGLRHRYEEHHGLEISDDAITAAVELSKRYIADRFLPDKAVDLIDEAAARLKNNILTLPDHLRTLQDEIDNLNDEKMHAVSIQDYEKAAEIRDRQRDLRAELEAKKSDWLQVQSTIVGQEDIASVVSDWTGIPVKTLTKEESANLINLEQTLHKRIVGQEEAVKAVSKAIRRSRVGIREPGRPVGSFLFLGPTGVGKTELCRALAEVLFKDERAIIRMDMSEYMEKHSVAKFIGSPPGYVGYDEGGQLTEQVRRKPYSVVLFDEIEKAHPEVWSSLLQIMDEGRLTDAQGRTVDFKNTIIVMTSNLGARDITGRVSLGFGGSAGGGVRPMEEIRDKVMSELKKTFQPEFLNRIDDVIVFHQLDRENIRIIAEKMADAMCERAEKLGTKLEFTKEAIDVLAEKGFDPVYGARPLKRQMRAKVEDAVAQWMLEHPDADEVTLIITAEDDDIKVKQRIDQTV